MKRRVNSGGEARKLSCENPIAVEIEDSRFSVKARAHSLARSSLAITRETAASLAGRVGTGMSEKTLWMLHGRLAARDAEHAARRRTAAQDALWRYAKAAIYSAGTIFMRFFSIENRYLTRGTRLMIHERKLDKQVHINGPLTTCVAPVTAALHEIEAFITIQNEGFENFIRGSKVTFDEVLRRAPGNWYIEANEAKALELVAEVL
jgi:hypothetical protein